MEAMGPAEWLTLAGIVLGVLYQIQRAIWKLSHIDTEVTRMNGKLSRVADASEAHAAECDVDRSQTNATMKAHDHRLTILEGGISAAAAPPPPPGT